MADAVTLLARFRNRLLGLDRTRRRIDRFAQQGRLKREAAEQIYESLFLTAFTSFESFLEDLFLSLLVGPPPKRGGPKPRVVMPSLAVARHLVVGRRYVDWLPFEKTTERAELYFTNGLPFANVLAPERRLLQKAHLMRNAIAHRSRHSQRRFEEDLIGATPLPARERTPSGFLRGSHTSPGVTRYEFYVNELLGVASSLAQ